MDRKRKVRFVLSISVAVSLTLIAAILLSIPLLSSATAGDHGVVSSSPSTPGDESAAVPSPAPVPACDFAEWVGKPVDEAAVKATGRPYRILKPGDEATMDYSADRINLHVDDAGVVVEVRCG